MPPEVEFGTRKPSLQTTRKPVRVHVEPSTSDHPSVTIETPRLILRAIEPRDEAAFVELLERARDHLMPVLPTGDENATPEAIFARQLELTQQGEKTGKAFRRIATNRTGSIVGAFNLVVIRRGLENNADANCWLDPERMGVGLAREGLLALMSYSLADLPEGLGMHRVDAWIQPENKPSQKLYASCGFVKSGDESSHLTTGDAWHVHDRWQLTIDAWQREFG
ncbi:MAG: GNAT family N-acetyltransferase [Phycisphaera sp.]|nr:GNAT family N-acetyltransferase [Phycisphaera sp.]